ncbi:MAG TPA: polysaccharide biosynthesis/export family protein [Candidatus Krumholzibacteria bacterium]|nr:polysaccharide biosynthesis/export family protein [Candidatus Krumholzibacteria bacterium]HPD70792.1 polysaccharide biosynthesis/export family protein [Candidatus Krumholzibacteria bacterium]HRY39508.1 polysaccharide biosynthesis/export family protein [Candidatus Krumholzibacteria bacterium]
MNGIAPARISRFSGTAGCSLLLLALGLAAGCGSAPSPVVRTDLVPFTPEQQTELARAKSAEYRLRNGDKLAIDFKYEDELDSTNLVILPDGRLTLPGGVDPVLARGLTVVELDSTLTACYALDYRDPDLSVIVENLGDLHVYVMGEVKQPGQVVLPPGGMGVLQAIAYSGGFDDDARPHETVVMRVTPGGFLLRQIDLSHLQRRGIPDMAALDLQPYDVIYVPRSAIGDFSYFSRSVLEGLVKVSQIFWDIYAIANIGRVETIWR